MVDKRHHPFRQDLEIDLATGFAEQKLSDMKRATIRLERMLAAEKPVILPGERIVGLRTIRKIPEIFTPDEWEAIKRDHYVHELGNIIPIY